MMKRRCCFHWKCMFLLLFFLCVADIAPHKAIAEAKEETKAEETWLANKEDTLSLSVRYGYENTVKYGRYTMVTGEIRNKGSREFEGIFQGIIPKSKDNALYQESVRVKPGETGKVTLYMPVVDDTGYLQVKLLNKKKDTEIEHNYRFTFGNYDKTIYTGVLTDNRESVAYLDSLNLKPFYLTEDTLTDNQLGLDLLDVLIINDFDVTKLNDKQTEAIRQWVWQGGTLVLTAGKYASETEQVFGEDFGISIDSSEGSMKVSALCSEDDLKGLKQYILDFQKSRKLFFQEILERNQRGALKDGENYLFDSVLGFYTAYNVREWSEEEIAALKAEEVTRKVSGIHLAKGVSLVEENGRELLLYSKRGSGNVQLFGFDIGLEKEGTTAGLSVMKQIAEHISEARKTQLDNEYYGWYISDGLMNYIASGAEKKIPVTYRYVIILSAYLILAGPFTYLYLRKRRKQGYGLLMVSVLAVVFTVVIFIAGKETRITKPFADYLRITDYTDKGMDKVDLSLNMPNNYDYTLNLTKKFPLVEMTDANPYIQNYGSGGTMDYDNAKKVIQYDSSSIKLTVKDNTAFTPVYYQGNFKTDKRAGSLSGSLAYTGNGVTGTIRNDYGFDITNGILMYDGHLIDIGSLGKGQEISLKNASGYYVMSIDDLYNTSLLKSLTALSEEGKDRNENVRLNQLISIMIENNYSQGDYKDCIIGLKKGGDEKGDSEAEELLSQISSIMQTRGTEIVKIPVNISKTKDGKEFVHSIDPYILTEGSKNLGYYSSRYMINDSLLLSYQFPAEEKILEFSVLKSQNGKGISKYTQSFNGAVSFLNVKTGKYEEVFTDNYDTGINASDYLTENNILTVRYRQEASLQDYQVILPYISYWKEAEKNADH